MSNKMLSKLLSMICDPMKRQYLIDFKIVGFCVSKQVERTIGDTEEAFYVALSKAMFDENGYAEASFNHFKLFITAIKLSDEEQVEDIFIFHTILMDEELERQLEQQEMENWIESGAVEIE